MSLRSPWTPIAALCLFFPMHMASANEYSAAMKAKKYTEVAAAAHAALAKDPNNANALIVKSKLLTIQNPETQLDEAVKLAEKCVAAHPKNAECHDALGSVLGIKALRGGLMASIGSVGAIRDAFKKAVELDPQNMQARFHLLQYYLQAPGIVGGGIDKAQTLAADTAKVNAEGGKMMLAMITLFDGKSAPATAEALALKVQPGDNEAIADTQRDILLAVGWRYKKEKQIDNAARVFRDAQKRFPDADGPPFGMAVLVQEQGKHAEAIALLQQAIAMTPSAKFEYFLALSLQATNEKAKAVAAFEKALSSKPGLNKTQKADAETRLKALKA